MWDDWKKAWQEAVANFERELASPDEDYATPSGRATAMRRDLAAARNALKRLEGDLEQAGKDLTAEEESEQTARRRAEMAGRINDAETVRIALEFAERHTHRAGILRRKVDVLRDELAMRQEELAGMERSAAAELPKVDASASAERIDKDRDEFNFRKMERERKEREAEIRLEELKKRMQ